MNEEGRKAQTQSFMWLFRSGEDGLPAIILYGYSPTRGGSHAREFLEGYNGYLETDGYQGYNNLPEIKLFFVKHFSLKKASEFPVFIKGFSLLLAGINQASLRMRACSIR